MIDILFSSATAMATAIANKSLSSLEIIEEHLAHIEKVNPALNAIVQLAPQRALDEAREADRFLAARGQVKGPLHGVPMTIKDSFDTQGVISTAGTKGRAQYIPEEDAFVVQRLRQAGAILLGKTNTSEFTCASTSETTNPVYGRTCNPYNREYGTSASSGGAAAAVASGCAAFDIGTDTGGSIRDPAHVCGVVGLKPTSGRVSKTGHIISHGAGPLDFLTQPGPIARYVCDVALLLPLICGEDGVDPGVISMPLRDWRAIKLKELRIATFTDNGLAKAEKDVQKAVENTACLLRDTGCQVENTLPKAMEQSLYLGRELRRADGFLWLRDIITRAGTKMDESSVAWMPQNNSPVRADHFSRILSDLEVFRSDMLQFMQQYDAIICPVTSSCAKPHDTTKTDDFAEWSNMGCFNLTGYPAASVRVNTSGSSLPVGVQIVAAPWREDIVLALASHIEEAFGGYQRPDLS